MSQGNVTPSEQNYSTSANSRCEYHNTIDAQENYLKYNIIKMVDTLKEEMNKSIKETEENKIKQVKEINKIVNDLKINIEAINKMQS